MTKPLRMIFILLLALSPKLHAKNKAVTFTAKATNGSHHSAHFMCPEPALNTLLSTNLWQPANEKNHYDYKNLFADEGYHRFIRSISKQAIDLGCTEGIPI